DKEDVEINEVAKKKIKGTIKVISTIKSIEGEPLTGVKINLYVTNGVSPRLVRSGFTDKSGVVIFSGLECGSYRVIEIIDKKYFEKPIYKKWNEVNIIEGNTYEEVYVINRIKEYYV
ncbi:MAG: SpaA isopeptide-forming pilin-related protein, partial [Clostridium sp.]